VPAVGGACEKLIPGEPDQANPTWSADGRSLAFAGVPWLKEFAADSTAVRIYDFATGKVETVPGSQGLWSPRWSPDGRFLVAERTDSQHLVLLDRQTGVWSDLAAAPEFVGYTQWSRNGEFLYWNTHDRPGIFRVRLKDRKVENVLKVNGIHVMQTLGRWFGLAPDDSPLILRDASVTEIYALELGR